MSDEMDKIRKQNKSKQEELAKSYPTSLVMLCETLGCKNTVTFENQSEMEKALEQGKPYCTECFNKKLGT